MLSFALTILFPFASVLLSVQSVHGTRLRTLRAPIHSRGSVIVGLLGPSRVRREDCAVDCGDDTCCPSGFFCDSIGCCPNGESCSGPPIGCPASDDIPCGEFCCLSGQSCVADECEDGGDPDPITTEEQTTTAKKPTAPSTTEEATPTGKLAGTTSADGDSASTDTDFDTPGAGSSPTTTHGSDDPTGTPDSKGPGSPNASATGATPTQSGASSGSSGGGLGSSTGSASNVKVVAVGWVSIIAVMINALAGAGC